MDSVNRFKIGIRFAPLLIGLIVPLIIHLSYDEMRRNDKFLPICLVLVLAFSAANWFVFGRTRLWIRYLIFVMVFFALPFVLWSISPRNSNDAAVFSMMGFIAALMDAILLACGMRVVKSKNNRPQKISSQDSNDVDRGVFQYSILSIFALTLFIGATISAFLAWVNVVGIDSKQLRDLYAEPIIVAIYLINVVSLIASLSKRVTTFAVILGGLLTLGICYYEPELSRRKENVYYLSFLYFLFVAVYSIPRIRGYHWTWRAPWKKRGQKQSINESAPHGSKSENIPVPPPLPTHQPGVKEIAEPPIVKSSSTLPSQFDPCSLRSSLTQL